MKSKYDNWDISLIGNAHLTAGKEKQDYSYSKVYKDKAIAIVADGHGGEKYIRSKRGSELAVKSAVPALDDFAKNIRAQSVVDEDNCSQIIKQLTDRIVLTWKESVIEDAKEEPFNEEELLKLHILFKTNELSEHDIETTYGSTLVAFLITKEYTLGIQIGDGKCFIVDDSGLLIQAIPDDEKCFLNTTTSLSDKNAYDEFRHCFWQTEKKPPACVFVSTDGIDALYGHGEHIYNFFQTLFCALMENNKIDYLKELTDLLKAISPTSDDISIACIYDKNNKVDGKEKNDET